MDIAGPNLEALASLNWLQIFLFGVYPYIALAVAIVGTWVRFDLSQYSWKSGSTQMLSSNAKNQEYALSKQLFPCGYHCRVTWSSIWIANPAFHL